MLAPFQLIVPLPSALGQANIHTFLPLSHSVRARPSCRIFIPPTISPVVRLLTRPRWKFRSFGCPQSFVIVNGKCYLGLSFSLLLYSSFNSLLLLFYLFLYFSLASRFARCVAMPVRWKKEREHAYNRRFNSICQWPRRWSISNAAEPRAGLSKASRKAKSTAERRSTRDSIYTVRKRTTDVGVNYPRHGEARLCTAIRWPIARNQLFSLAGLLVLFLLPSLSFSFSPALLLLFFPISRRVAHNPTPAPAGKRVADLGTNSHSTCRGAYAHE